MLIFSTQAVFGMGSLVTHDTGNGLRIEVSSDFWIYWAVVAPLTVLLVVAWIVWINRNQLLSRGKKKMGEWLDGSNDPHQAVT